MVNNTCAECVSWCGRCLRKHVYRLACSQACAEFKERDTEPTAFWLLKNKGS